MLGLAAYKAGFVPRRQLVRDASAALSFKLKGSTDDTTDAVRERILGAVQGMRVDDLVGLNEEVLPKLLAKIRPEAKRLLDLHRRSGRPTYIVSAAPVELVEPLAAIAGHDGRDRHPQRDRRGRLQRRARRAVRVRRRQGDGDGGAGPLGGPRPQPVLRLQRQPQRPADAGGGRAPGCGQPRRSAGPSRHGERLADRPLQPADQGPHPAHADRHRWPWRSRPPASSPAPSTPASGRHSS